MTDLIGKRASGGRRRHALIAIFVVAGALLAVAGSAAAPQKSAAGEPVNTALPTITGTPQVGQTLHATTGTWTSTTPITKVTYAWWRCDASSGVCAAIAGATGITYAPVDADVGHTIRLAVTQTNSAGSTTAPSDPTAVVTTLKPFNTALPTISGTPRVGQTLTAAGGTWTSPTSINTITYAWWRCDPSSGHCDTITGASGTSYKLVDADAGRTIRVAQTVTNSAGSATAASNATGTVTTADGRAAATALPDITGTAEVGQTLSTKGATWYSPTSITRVVYAWWRCNASNGQCTTIGGATGTTYQVAAADAGSTIRVAQTVTNSAGSTTAASNPTSVVGSPNPTNTALPTIAGTAQVGHTLSVRGGGWTSPTPITRTTYAWWRCDANSGNCGTIGGATRTSYVLTAADAGHTIRVAQTVSNSAGSTTAASNATAVVTYGAGGTTAPGGIAARNVKLPNRLVISGVRFTPRSLRSRNTFTAQFRVTDSSGRPVSGALVYALGLPYAWVRKGVEVATAQNGWATLRITPSRRMPLGRGHALVMFVRARVPGQPILGGSSSRRLVQVRIGY